MAEVGFSDLEGCGRGGVVRVGRGGGARGCGELAAEGRRRNRGRQVGEGEVGTRYTLGCVREGRGRGGQRLASKA
jgi:hypothetical protein